MVAARDKRRKLEEEAARFEEDRADGERPAWLTRPDSFSAWDAKGYADELARRLSGRVPTIIPV